MSGMWKYGIIGGIAAYITYKIVTRNKKEGESPSVEAVVGSVAVGFGVGLASAAVGTLANVNTTCAKLNVTFDDLSKATNVEISDAVVQEAVKKAAYDKANAVCAQAAQNVTVKIQRDMHEVISDYVEDAYKNVKGDVKNQLRQEIGKLNLKEIRKEVIKEAKEKAAEKFEEDLSTIADKYANNLDDVSKIYSTISDSIKEKFQNA